MRRICLLAFVILISSCFKSVGTSQGKRIKIGIANEQVGSKLKAPVSAASDEIQTVANDGAAKGTSVDILPGTLSISTSLVVEEGVSLQETSLMSEVGLPADVKVNAAAQGVIVRPSENVQLNKPLVLSLPLPVSSGIRLTQASYVVLAKYMHPTSKTLVSQMIVVDGIVAKLQFSAAANADVVVLNSYFGSFWVVEVSRAVLSSEVPAIRFAGRIS